MHRRRFLKVSALGALGLASSVFFPGRMSGQTSGHPNVLLIYSDDQGTLDTNLYGSKDLSTPHLDQLADQGVRFSQFYAASSVCSPSRAALLTGRYPQRAGLPMMAESRPELFGSGHALPASEVTIAERLRAAGYRTGHFGKWHLGATPGPTAQGFDESEGFLGGCIDKYSHFNYGGASWGSPPHRHDWYHNGVETYKSGAHSGDLITDGAIRFMETTSSRPFFLYLAFGNPHYPLQPYDKYLTYYRDLEEPRRTYAAMISTLDEQIGRVLNRLDQLGLRENTLIIFQSDQGHSTEARANYGGGNPGPYRGAKASLFEAGIRIPAMVSFPGRIPAGEVRNQCCTNCDWLPTIARICGADLPDRTIDGKDILPVILSKDAPAPHRVWHWQLGKQWAVRRGDWKLLMDVRDTSDGHHRDRVIPGPFLANLAEDPTEETNFANQHPDIVQQLTALHQEWLKDVQHE